MMSRMLETCEVEESMQKAFMPKHKNFTGFYAGPVPEKGQDCRGLRCGELSEGQECMLLSMDFCSCF